MTEADHVAQLSLLHFRACNAALSTVSDGVREACADLAAAARLHEAQSAAAQLHEAQSVALLQEELRRAQLQAERSLDAANGASLLRDQLAVDLAAALASERDALTASAQQQLEAKDRQLAEAAFEVQTLADTSV